MVKFLFGLLVLAQISWALPASIKACNSKQGSVSEFTISEGMMGVSLAGKDLDGKPYAAHADFQVLSNQDFTPGDFQASDLEVINSLADVNSFTGGTWIDIGMENQKPTSMLFFEFEPGQYSVLWLYQGNPIPMGKTNDCQ